MDPAMADPGFPAQGGAPPIGGGFRAGIRFDPSYIRTIPGILKIIQMALNIIGYICVAASWYPHHPRASFFDFVSMTGFWLTGILLVCYLLHVVERIQKIPWIKVELGYCALWVLFYLIASSLCADMGGQFPAWAAAAFFGFTAMLAYGADAFFKFRAFKTGEAAQGAPPMQMEPDMQSPGAY